MLDFDNIEHFVKDKLEGELLTAPTGEWDKLSTQLAKRRKRNLWRRLFIDSSIFLIFLAGFTINNFQDIDKNDHFNGGISSNSTEGLTKKSLINIDHKMDQAKSNHYSTIVDSNGQGTQKKNADHRASEPISKRKNELEVKSNQVDFQSSPSTKNNEKFIDKKNSPLFIHQNNRSSNTNVVNSNQPQKEGSANNRITRTDIFPYEHFVESTLNQLPITSIDPNIDKNLKSIKNGSGLGLKQLNRRFSIDFSIGLMSHGLVLDNQTDAGLKDQLRNTHSKNLGGNFNLNLNYSISSRFEIYTGLQLEQLSSKFTSSTTETYTEMVDTTFMYWDGGQQAWLTFVGLYEITKTKSVPFSSTNKYTLISIPFGVNYCQPLGARFYLTGTLGGAFQFTGNYSGYSHTLNNSEPVQVSDIFRKKSNLNAFSGVKVGYNLTERQSIYVMPWASIDINPSTSSTNDFSARFIKYGVRVGYRFNLIP